MGRSIAFAENVRVVAFTVEIRRVIRLALDHWKRRDLLVVAHGPVSQLDGSRKRGLPNRITVVGVGEISGLAANNYDLSRLKTQSGAGNVLVVWVREIAPCVFRDPEHDLVVGLAVRIGREAAIITISELRLPVIRQYVESVSAKVVDQHTGLLVSGCLTGRNGVLATIC